MILLLRRATSHQLLAAVGIAIMHVVVIMTSEMLRVQSEDVLSSLHLHDGSLEESALPSLGLSRVAAARRRSHYS